MEFITYIVVSIIGVWVGWHVRGIIFTAAISENPDKIIKLLEQIKKINAEEPAEIAGHPNKVEVLPELVNKVWYAYAKETGQFLGQGETIEAALEMAANRFPSKSFWCHTPSEDNQTA